MRFICLILAAFMSVSAFAQVESQINFRGQNSEVIKVQKNITVVHSESYQVPDTCTRNVPYETYECRNVTRSREQCSTVPSSQNCWTENDQVCRNVTRTRQECTQNPGREVCTERPTREICTERPTREVCRTTPSGQTICNTVGGGQSCHTVGGGQSCTTVADGESCRDVSYTDQDCDDIPRQRCETVPSHQECTDIPYSEEVCGFETHTREESYACTRRAQRDVSVAKKLTGEIQVHFQTNGSVEEFPIKISVAAPNNRFESFVTSVALVKEPKVLVILKKKEVTAKESASEINLQGEIVFELVEAKMVSPVFPTKLHSAQFDELTSVLSMSIEGSVSGKGSVEAVITARPRIGRNKTVAELKANYPSRQAAISANKLELNFEGLIQHELVKRNALAIKLSAPLSLKGELLNAKKPVMEKDYKLDLSK